MPPGPGIRVAHHRRTDIARGVEAVDHRTVVTQRAAVHVGADAALGAEVAGHHLGRVVRRVADLAEVRVRLVGRVAVVAVVGALAAVEVLVDARAREPVEPLDRRGQRVGGQPRLCGQLLERVGRDDDAGLHPLLRNALSRLQSREDVAVAVLLVEDQPGRECSRRGPGPGRTRRRTCGGTAST